MSVTTRDAGVRGVTSPSPEGWSVPDPAERLAALARKNGWDVIDQRWYLDRRKGLQTFFLAVGRPLRPGENSSRSAGPGVGWQYHLVWEEVLEEDRTAGNRSRRMTIRVSRAYTPSTGEWRNGPTIKVIGDTITRNPIR